MGKYDKVLPKLKKHDPFAENPKYGDQVRAMCSQILRQETPEEPYRLAASDTELREALASYNDALAKILLTIIDSPRGKRHGSELAKGYALVRRFKDFVDELDSQANLVKAAYEKLIEDQYENEGVRSLTVTGVGSLRTQPEPHTRVVNRDEFREWCIKNGLERSLSLPWQTANAIVKERLLAGDSLPEGVEAESKTKLVLTRE